MRCVARVNCLVHIQYIMSVLYLDLANLFNLVNILQKYLYFFKLFSVFLGAIIWIY